VVDLYYSTPIQAVFSKAALIFTDLILMMRVVLTMATPSSLERGGKPQGGRSYTA
jgi:hypothetical protein